MYQMQTDDAVFTDCNTALDMVTQIYRRQERKYSSQHAQWASRTKHLMLIKHSVSVSNQTNHLYTHTRRGWVAGLMVLSTGYIELFGLQFVIQTDIFIYENL